MSISDNFELIVLDLHNTIFDEVMEYGLAIDAAIVELEKFAPLNRQQLYTELSAAHKKLGSDWDDDAWKMLPSLKNFPDEVLDRAIKLRHQKSDELTLSGLYPQVVETLRKLKANGKHIYIVTEAAADVAMHAINLIGLVGIVDGVYSYPSRLAPKLQNGTFQKSFPKNGSSHLVKPNPLLLAEVAFDHGLLKGVLSTPNSSQSAFYGHQDDQLILPEFQKSASFQKDVSTKLVVNSLELKEIMNSMLYVGDSKFKDGLMARNAGVKFAYAAYGKKISGSETDFARSKEILYAVTGWDKETLKLTQEAGNSQTVNELKPDYILNAFSDLT